MEPARTASSVLCAISLYSPIRNGELYTLSQFDSQGLLLGIYNIPDASPLKTLPESDLPKDWATFPYPNSTQTIGGDWLSTGNEMGLLVPSSAVPEGLEKVLVINPQHQNCSTIQLIKSTKELYNKRTFSGV